MKRLLILSLFTLWLFAAGKFLSPLPLPKTVFIDLDIYPCNDACIKGYLDRNEIFSFLAKAKHLQNPELKKIYTQYASRFHVPSSVYKTSFAIEIVALKNLAAYTNKIAKALCAYALEKGYNFSIENRLVESQEELINSVNEANETDLVIVPLTYYQRSLITSFDTDIPIFIPTLHKSTIKSEQENIYFGGADYFAQLDKLLSFAGDKTSVFYLKDSELSMDLTTFVQEKIKNAHLYAIDQYIQNMKPILENNEDINESTVILNTPLLKSSMVLSQLTYYEIEPKYKLSTQINYDPKIFTLTQIKDRENLYLAISFVPLAKHLDAANELFDNHPAYEWLVFSSITGMENLLDRESVTVPMVDRQIGYPVEIVKTFAYHFESLEEDEQMPEGF